MITDKFERLRFLKKHHSKHKDLIIELLSSDDLDQDIKALEKQKETFEIALLFRACLDNDLKILKNCKTDIFKEIDTFNLLNYYLFELIAFCVFDKENINIFDASEKIQILFEESRLVKIKKISVEKILDKIKTKVDVSTKFSSSSKNKILDIIKTASHFKIRKDFYEICDLFIAESKHFSYDEIFYFSQILHKNLFYLPITNLEITKFENQYYVEKTSNSQEKELFMILALLIQKLVSTFPTEEMFKELDQMVKYNNFSFSLERYFFNNTSPDWISQKFENYFQGFVNIDEKAPKELIDVFKTNNKVSALVKSYKDKKLSFEFNKEDKSRAMLLKLLMPICYYYDYFIRPLDDTEYNLKVKRGWKARILDLIYNFYSYYLERANIKYHLDNLN